MRIRQNRTCGTEGTLAVAEGTLEIVSDSFDAFDDFDDEVPQADAFDQLRPVSEPAETDDLGDGPPLESSESDWHEQSLVVEDPDPDEIR